MTPETQSVQPPVTDAPSTTAAAVEAQEAADGQLLAGIIQELIDAQYSVPRQAIKLARQHREQITPLLIDQLREGAKAVRDGEDFDNNGPYLSMLLLAEFRATEALPALLDVLTLPGEGPFNLFGDGVTEDVSRVLAVLAVGQVELLDGLVRDVAVNEYVRWGAQTAMVMQVRDGTLDRHDALERLRRQLQEQMQQQESEQVSMTVCSLCDLGAGEAMEEVMRAFDEGLVDESMIDRKLARKDLAAMASNGSWPFARLRESGIKDTIKEVAWIDDIPNREAAAERRQLEKEQEMERARLRSRRSQDTVIRKQPKVGRNDPCRCGSGRKFKKCCGRLES